MKYLWIIILTILGGFWSFASIVDIIDSIRRSRDLEPSDLELPTLAWIFTIIVGLFFWSLALWFLG